MWTHDFLRVLHGAGKVAEQIAVTQVPEITTKTRELAKHASELARVAPYLLNSVDGHSAADTNVNAATPAAAPSSDAVQETVPNMDIQQQHQPLQFHTTQPPTSPVTSAMTPDFVNANFGKADVKAKLPDERSFKPATEKAPEAKQSEAVRGENAEDDKPTYQTVQEVLEEAQQNTMEDVQTTPTWQERHVPSSPLSRIIGFGSLAAKLAVGTATEIVRSGGKGGTYNALISDSNAEKLAETLCTMRGAALKLGQMLSIQDENLIPSKLADALDRVRQNAHVMPKAQLHQQLSTELGENWRDNFKEFDDVPIAAASIGQVHRATLTTGERVAIKIQYPGVAESIESDLLNLKRLVTYTNILPRGLYIDEIIRVGQEELTAECNYSLEADNQDRFRELIHQSGMDNAYIVPRVHREFSTARILTTELISGVAVDKVVNLSQEVRNTISRRILELTIRELFDWRFMQTDPNWSNFMYNAATNKIGLVDFGAAREYPKSFVDEYFNIVWAAANQDEDRMMKYSIKMKFLTGDESPAMLRAHIAAGMVVGEPFRSSEPFDFHKSQLTKRLGQHTETFMHGRLTPPPQEVYSLHRKLAGAFLMCIKLRAVVPCRDVLEDVYRKYVQEQQQ